MKIEYKDADGRVMELDVSDEIGQFYLSSVEEAEKSDRRNTRPDRHTSLETFVYEDQRFFASASNPMKEVVDDCEVERLLSCLNDRQNYTDYKLRQISAHMMGLDEFSEAEFEEQIEEITAFPDGSLEFHFKEGRAEKWQRA